MHVRCKSRVHRDGRTINRRLTMPTISQRGQYFFGHANINSLFVDDVSDCTPPVQVLFPIHPQYEIVSLPSQHVEGAEVVNSSKIRDRSPLVRKMSYRTRHPKKSGRRKRFFRCLLRRGVPPKQCRLQGDTENPTWDSTCCAHDTQSFLFVDGEG